MLTISPSQRPLILASVMAANFMIAIEATIISTAMPQIVAQLGDLRLYAWVFSSYLLAQSTTTVLFGKLADTFGRRVTLYAGLAIFLIGSILCGLSWSMLTLVLFRAVQGLGAGAIQPVTITIVGDLYPAHERGKVQGWLASVWGVSAVLGPLVGGLIVQNISWAWVFWINVPLGIAAAIGFTLFLRETIEHRERRIDFAGAAWFALAIAGLMVALTEAGTDPRLAAAAAAVFVAALALFVRQERRAPEPIVDFELWGRRTIALVNIVTLISGAAIIGLTTFLPVYVQAVLGRTPLVAGLTFTVMLVGWPIAATVAAKNVMRLGLRRTLLIGAVLLPAGGALFLLLGPGMSPLVPALGSLVMGLGMGFLSTSGILIVQDSVGWAERGAATASNVFARNLGNTLGAALFGALFNLALLREPGNISSDRIRSLLDRGGAVDVATRTALDHGLHITFVGLFVVAALGLLFAVRMPHIVMTPRAAPAS